MDAVRKKVLLDLFASPWSVLPIAGGLSAWMLSWGIDGSTALNLGGLIGVLGGLGVMTTRLVFGIEKITQDAFDFLTTKEKEDRQRQLDELDGRLQGDDNPKTEKYLRELRQLYDGFAKDVEEGKLSPTARPVLDQVHKLFKAAVKHLEHSYDLWERSQDLSGAAKKSLLKERKRVVEEVRDTIEHLSVNMEQFHVARTKESESELAKLRKELDATMEVARRAERRVSDLEGQTNTDSQQYE